MDVPTHAAAVLRMASGPLATLAVSFETRGQYVSGLTVHGTGGILTLPDANAFTGDGTSFMPRPDGRSGWLITRATSKPAAWMRASATRANSGVPAKTMRMPASRGRLRRELPRASS